MHAAEKIKRKLSRKLQEPLDLKNGIAQACNPSRQKQEGPKFEASLVYTGRLYNQLAR